MTFIEDLDLENGRSATRSAITFLPEPEPSELWCPIISVDDHVLEPADLFVSRLPHSLRDSAPHVETDGEGVPYWVFGGVREPMRMMTCGAIGRPMSEWSVAPQKYEEFRAGVWQPAARVADMDLNGIWASLSFPSFVFGFAGRRLNFLDNADLALATVRAYNDWMIEEWCGGHPERFIACQLPWLHDPTVAAEMVRENAARGFKAISFPENPEVLGLPTIYTGHWDPLYAACEETDTVINLHVGSSGQITVPCSDSPSDVQVALFPVAAIVGVVDWVFSKVAIRFPGLRIVMSEGGASWVPMVMERLRRAYRQAESSSVWTPTDPDPVELLNSNFWFTSIEDPAAFRLLDVIGEDKVMLESDYPHADSNWPRTQDLARRDLEGLDKDVVRQVCYRTAATVYRHSEPPAELLAASVIGG